jgi:hypothetical protein
VSFQTRLLSGPASRALEYLKLNSKQIPHSQVTDSLLDNTIWFNNETGVLQILLTKEKIGLSDGNIEILGKVFEPKEEVHITIIGTTVGQQLKEAMKRNPSIESQIRQLIVETNWTYEIGDKLYHVSKDKIIEEPPGGSKVVRTESIILIVEVASIRHFYEKLSRMLQMNLEVPPTHVTLYTSGDSFGIGLNNQAEFREYVTSEILRDDMKHSTPKE